MKDNLYAMFGVSTVVLLIVVIGFLDGIKKKPTLKIYNWADYIAPELIEKFEKDNNCKIIYDTFDSNEALLAKLQAGAEGYDLIFPSHYVIDTLVMNKKLQVIDRNRLTMYEYLDEDVLAQLPPGCLMFSMPYMMSYTGIGYNKDVIKDFKPSWSMFDREDFHRRATLLDDKKEVIGAALMYLGLDANSINEADLAKAKEVILKWKKNIVKLENEQYKNGLATKEFILSMGYSGDVIQVVKENSHLNFAIPEEGTMINCDMMAIPNTAKNIDLAYKFINFIHEPKNAAINMEYVYFPCPNKEAYKLISDELKTNPAMFISDEIFKKSKFTENHGDKEAILNRLWDDIKASH